MITTTVLRTWKWTWKTACLFIFTDGQDASSSRGDCWEVHLGPVWSFSHASLIPIRGDGEPLPHLCLTHSACELYIAMLLWFMLQLFKVMNWLISSSSITGWWQISCKCKQSSNLLAQREPGNEASNLHVGFTFSILSMMTYCGRLYVTTFTFSELSSTHVFTYNGQWIMPSANWHSCQYQNQSSCLYVPHYTYVYNYSCYTVTHLSNGSCQYWYMTLYE